MSLDAEPEELRCARHPKVETRLRCGRCDTPICPKCMVMTDVGARCPDCAPRRRLPQFEIGPVFLLRGLAAALAAGAAAGLLWGALIPGGLGFFSVFLGIGIGYAVAEPVSWATNRKAGPVLGALAAAGVLLAYVVRSLVAFSTALPTHDIAGYIALVIGAIVAINRLRY